MPIASSRRSKTFWVATARILIPVAVAMLSGCSSEGSNDWSTVFTLMRQVWRGGDSAVNLNEASAIPYATLGIRIGGDQEHIVVLATDVNGERLWVSAEKVALTTRNGRIVATAGLPHNLSALIGGAGAADGAWKTPRHITWTADFADQGMYSVNVDCDDVLAGPETIIILGADIDTMRVDESCRSNQLDWTFSNTYWVSLVSNRVWRSIQHIHPRADPVEIELLRPPQSED